MLLGALQENVITLLCYDAKHAPIIRGTVDLALYGGSYRLIAARLYDYLDRFKKPPGDHLPDLLSDKLEAGNREAQFYTDIIESIHTTHKNINAEYVMAQLETFIKRQSLRAIAVDLHKALQRDTEESLEEAANLIAGANKSTLSLFDPGTRLSDKKRALRFLDINESALPTGIPELDKRGLGPTRKELWLLIANAKRGKCIAEGEPVLMADGRYIPIEKIKDGEHVVSLNEENSSFERKKVSLIANGLKPILDIKTRTGRCIKLTANHRLLTKSGWKLASALKVGDEIAAPYEADFFGLQELNDYSSVRLLGYMIADGGMTKPNCPTFTKQDSEIISDLALAAERMKSKLVQARTRADTFYIVGNGRVNGVVEFLRVHHLMEKKSCQKNIPPLIFRLTRSGVAEFLKALFSCDGSVYGNIQPEFEYGSTSKELIYQIHHLLTRFGLIAKIRERWQKVAGSPYCSWTITLRGRRQLRLLQKQIGLIGSKKAKLKKLLEGQHQERNPYIANNRQGDIFFDKVVSINRRERCQTYDLSVEDNHNFIASNLIVHNSWALIHLAKIVLMQRVRVVHITLEMSEDRCSQRYFQALFAMAKRNEPFQITKFKKDEFGYVIDSDDVRVMPKLSMDDPKIRKQLEAKIDRWGTRVLDNIIVKQFPTGMLTVRELEAYLDNLEATEQFTPDLLIVDYPDLMKLDKKNVRFELDDTYKNLRGLLVKRNIAGAVVSQSHRSSEKAKQVGVENVAEAYSKIAHADVVITYSQTEAEHELGLARLHVAAGRNDEDKFSIVISQNYGLGNFVVDSAMMTKGYWKMVGHKTEEGLGGELPED